MKSLSGLDKLAGDPDPVASFANTTLENIGDAQFLTNFGDIDILVFKLERRRRAATRSFSILARRFKSSSESPSEKYSYSGSADILANGSTAIDCESVSSLDFSSSFFAIFCFTFRSSSTSSIVSWYLSLGIFCKHFVITSCNSSGVSELKFEIDAGAVLITLLIVKKLFDILCLSD